MPKCKLCGSRIAEGVAVCPVCGASVTENGKATSAPVMENVNLPKYKCPSCKADIVGEHRFCPHCGINLQEAEKEAQKAAKDEAKEKHCPKCGAILLVGAKFCADCGARLGNEETEVQKVSESLQTKNQAAEEKTQNERPSEAIKTSAPTKKMGFFEAIASGFRKYANFKGRARRKEFWCFSIVAYLLSGIFMGYGLAISSLVLGLLLSIAIMIPWLAVAVRRLHDRNVSGWLLLLVLTGVGIIPLTVLFMLDGTKGQNKYGEDPKGRTKD